MLFEFYPCDPCDPWFFSGLGRSGCGSAALRVPWLRNELPMDMPATSDIMVCLLALPQDPDEHRC